MSRAVLLSAHELVDTALADAFREGRAGERKFAAATARLDGWGDEQWRARIVELQRQISYAFDDLRTAVLYGRLSIVLDLLEGKSLT